MNELSSRCGSQLRHRSEVRLQLAFAGQALTHVLPSCDPSSARSITTMACSRPLPVENGATRKVSRRCALAAFLVPFVGLLPASAASNTANVSGPDTEKAAEEFRRVTGLQDLAFEYTNQKKFAQAEILWTKLIGMNDKNAAAYSNRGNCRTSQGKFQEAVDDFDRAITLAPTEPDPFLGKGVALEGQEKFEDAIRAYETANSLSKTKYKAPDPVALNNIGNAYGQLGDWKKAYMYHKDASDMDSRFVFALADEALALFQLGDDDSATKKMRFLTRKYPGFADMHAALAMAEWEGGRQADAEEEWYRAIQSDSRYEDVGWVREIRRWPPRLVKILVSFRAIS